MGALYARYVEEKIKDPDYDPACNNSWGSCATVFTSSYAHPLSHLEILEENDPLNLSLAVIGMILYSAYFVAISIRRAFPLREELFLFVAATGVIFSMLFLYIIKVILQDFCIVC